MRVHDEQAHVHRIGLEHNSRDNVHKAWTLHEIQQYGGLAKWTHPLIHMYFLV